ncbi:MAG TPA: SPW repeat protein [Trueperaceae bacterium]
MTHTDNRPDPVRPIYARYASGPLLVLGLWLALSPFLFDYTVALATWVDVVGGLLVALLALLRLLRPLAAGGLTWVSFLVGLFMVVMPIFFQFAGTDPAFWINLITGLIVAILAAMSAGEALGIKA